MPARFDVAGATWLPVPAHLPTRAAFAAELEAAAPGTAYRYGTQSYVVYIHTGERGWLAMHGTSFEAALAAYDDLCAAPPAELAAHSKSAQTVAGEVLSNWAIATTTLARRR